MEEEEDTSPPFWMQNTTGGGGRRLLRRSYSMFLNSGAVLIFVLVIALALVLIIAPTLHSFTSHILKPQSVKKSWDSLNLVLVLFAILCGFLSRNNTNETPRSYRDQTFTEATQEYEKPNPETPVHWYEYSDRTPYYRPYNRLRSINSYPDLRQDSPWLDADERWRFYDDTHVNRYRGVGMDSDHRREEEKGTVKNIEVDTFEVRMKEVPSAPPLSVEAQQSPPPPPPRRKDNRRNAGMIEKQKNKESEDESLKPRQTTPPPPPPPPPPLPAVQKKNKRGSATKDFFISLKGKKKKQRQRSVENFESMLNSEPPTTLPPRQTPPPPPPPPPPSVLHNLFSSKKTRPKKGHSDYPPSHVSSSKTKPHVVADANLKPRLRENFYSLEDNVITGNESPLIPIPPPPPPPPFKLPAWKFKVQGDYVRVDSIGSSSSGSPELDEVEDPPTSEATPQGGEEAEIMLFYPSPDVDTKADTFIERFRAGLRMEKQGIGMSNLGPSPYSQKTGPKLKLHNSNFAQVYKKN